MKLFNGVIVFLVLLSAMECTFGAHASKLKNGFYKKSCPNVEQIAREIIWKRVAQNAELSAKFLRMFFHDCFVRGCDGSVLINSTANNVAEKDAVPNLSLAGFEIIEEVKCALERECPHVVSCADIVALAARDSVSFQFRKDLWEVQLGRRDGRISTAASTVGNIPTPFSNFSTLINVFASKTLDLKDLVVLSGGHTIGIGHCNFFSNRLYNFTGRGDADPSLDPKYAAFLRTKCRNLTDTTTVPLDRTPTNFDTDYYTGLKKNRGIFTSDAALTDSRSRKLVNKLTNPENFLHAFKNSMKRMGSIQVLTGENGEIRRKCSVVN